MDHGQLAYQCGSRLKSGGNNKNNKSETDKCLLDHGRLAYRCGSFQKGQGSPGRNKTPRPWSAGIPMWQLFKGPRDDNVHPFRDPSDESKVHIEVLSVLWGNRLLIPDGSLPLSSCLKGGGNNKSETDKSLLDHGRLAYRCGSFQKGQGSPGRNKTPRPWSARIPMWQLFKGLEDNNVAIILIKPNFNSGVI
ncbi:hypothetical protein Tco_1086151 [Tanacetum coccineum]